LAENAAGKLIDLGTLRLDERGKFNFRLNSLPVSGYGFSSVAEALGNLAQKVTWPYLAGEFDQSRNRPATRATRLAPQVQITLEETPQGARADVSHAS